DPDIRSVKGHRFWSLPDRERPERCSVTRPELGHATPARIHDPDIRTVERARDRANADAESAQQTSITCPQLRDAVAAKICYPDIGSVKSYADRVAPDGKRSQRLAVAGTQLGHATAASIRDPDAGSVERQAPGARAHGEACCLVCAIPVQDCDLQRILARRRLSEGPSRCKQERKQRDKSRTYRFPHNFASMLYLLK